jgi:hypothetical protein
MKKLTLGDFKGVDCYFGPYYEEDRVTRVRVEESGAVSFYKVFCYDPNKAAFELIVPSGLVYFIGEEEINEGEKSKKEKTLDRCMKQARSELDCYGYREHDDPARMNLLEIVERLTPLGRCVLCAIPGEKIQIEVRKGWAKILSAEVLMAKIKRTDVKEAFIKLAESMV